MSEIILDGIIIKKGARASDIARKLSKKPPKKIKEPSEKKHIPKPPIKSNLPIPDVFLYPEKETKKVPKTESHAESNEKVTETKPFTSYHPFWREEAEAKHEFKEALSDIIVYVKKKEKPLTQEEFAKILPPTNETKGYDEFRAVLEQELVKRGYLEPAAGYASSYWEWVYKGEKYYPYLPSLVSGAEKIAESKIKSEKYKIAENLSKKNPITELFSGIQQGLALTIPFFPEPKETAISDIAQIQKDVYGGFGRGAVKAYTGKVSSEDTKFYAKTLTKNFDKIAAELAGLGIGVFAGDVAMSYATEKMLGIVGKGVNKMSKTHEIFAAKLEEVRTAVEGGAKGLLPKQLGYRIARDLTAPFKFIDEFGEFIASKMSKKIVKTEPKITAPKSVVIEGIEMGDETLLRYKFIGEEDITKYWVMGSPSPRTGLMKLEGPVLPGGAKFAKETAIPYSPYEMFLFGEKEGGKLYAYLSREGGEFLIKEKGMAFGRGAATFDIKYPWQEVKTLSDIFEVKLPGGGLGAGKLDLIQESILKGVAFPAVKMGTKSTTATISRSLSPVAKQAANIATKTIAKQESKQSLIPTLDVEELIKTEETLKINLEDFIDTEIGKGSITIYKKAKTGIDVSTFPTPSFDIEFKEETFRRSGRHFPNIFYKPSSKQSDVVKGLENIIPTIKDVPVITETPKVPELTPPQPMSPPEIPDFNIQELSEPPIPPFIFPGSPRSRRRRGRKSKYWIVDWFKDFLW